MSNNAKAAAAASEKPRSGSVPDILKHQNSFELRYSPIIHKQILETSINREVLQRQMNAFFPFRAATSIDAAPSSLQSSQATDTTVNIPQSTEIASSSCSTNDNKNDMGRNKVGKVAAPGVRNAPKATIKKSNPIETIGRTKLLVRLERLPLKPDVELDGSGSNGMDSVDD